MTPAAPAILLAGFVALLLAGALAGIGRRGARVRAVWLGSLGLVALASLWSYTFFGAFHQYDPFRRHDGRPHLYHHHDLYHYYLGSKYYAELGHRLLYACTVVAFDDLARTGVRVPAIAAVRRLAAREAADTPAGVIARDGPACRARFRPERWRAFTADLRAFLRQPPSSDGWWQEILLDAGFNPPPSFALVSGTVARLIPLTPTTFELIPLLDLACVVLLAGGLVYWAFGAVPLFAYWTCLGCNWLAHYRWTGGSLLRHAWLLALVAAVCCLRRRRWGWAGIAFGVSTALAMFPALFLLGALVSLLGGRAGRGGPAGPAARVALGAALGFAALALPGLAVYGLDHWREFVHHIVEHGRVYFVNSVGYAKVATFRLSDGGQTFSLDGFNEWNRVLDARFAAYAAVHHLVRGCLLGVGVLIGRRLAPERAAVLLGGGGLFVFFMATSYYYLYLALCPVVWYAAGGRALLRASAAPALLIAVAVISRATDDVVVQNGYVSWALFAYFAAVLLSLAPRADADDPGDPRPVTAESGADSPPPSRDPWAPVAWLDRADDFESS